MLEQLDIAIGFVVVMLLLSMLITVVVQAVSAAFDLRGRNLVWGLTKLFHQISPEFQAKATRDWNELRSSVGKKLAEAVSHHPTLSHSLSGRAKAIRPEELIAVLRDLAKNPPADLDAKAKVVLQTWADKIAPAPEALSVATALLAQVNNAMPGYAAEFQSVIQHTLGAAGRLQQGVERGFGTVMDRTSDVFLRWTKTITIASAFCLAFVLHVDSIDIYKQISTNSEIRAKLGSIADETAKKASDVLSVDSTRIAKAAASIRDDPGLSSTQKQSIDSMRFQRCGDAEKALRDWNVDAALVGKFDQSCQEQALDQLSSVGTSLQSVKSQLDGSKVRLTSGRWNWSNVHGIPTFFSQNISIYPLRHWLGVLSTAFLLSLGAPFWFNALNQLASLKPSIARKIDSEQQQQASAPQPAESAKAASA